MQTLYRGSAEGQAEAREEAEASERAGFSLSPPVFSAGEQGSAEVFSIPLITEALKTEKARQKLVLTLPLKSYISKLRKKTLREALICLKNRLNSLGKIRENQGRKNENSFYINGKFSRFTA